LGAIFTLCAIADTAISSRANRIVVLFIDCLLYYLDFFNCFVIGKKLVTIILRKEIRIIRIITPKMGVV
jgi:hypothetical protein